MGLTDFTDLPTYRLLYPTVTYRLTDLRLYDLRLTDL